MGSTMLTTESVNYGLWVTWLTSWIAAMFWSGRTEKKDSVGAELIFRALFYLGLILLFALPQRNQFWHLVSLESWILNAIVAVGLAFNLVLAFISGGSGRTAW